MRKKGSFNDIILLSDQLTALNIAENWILDEKCETAHALEDTRADFMQARRVSSTGYPALIASERNNRGGRQVLDKQEHVRWEQIRSKKISGAYSLQRLQLSYLRCPRNGDPEKAVEKKIDERLLQMRCHNHIKALRCPNGIEAMMTFLPVVEAVGSLTSTLPARSLMIRAYLF